MAEIAVINGPNLNLLGLREPGVYGSTTLAELEAEIRDTAEMLNVEVSLFQSNHEGAIIDQVHGLRGAGARFLIINPGGLTHTSVCLRDALAGVAIPFIEVHLTNIHAREEFRRRSLLSDIATGVICGLGPRGYLLALREAASRLAMG